MDGVAVGISEGQ
jgi:hypothetical protein